MAILRRLASEITANAKTLLVVSLRQLTERAGWYVGRAWARLPLPQRDGPARDVPQTQPVNRSKPGDNSIGVYCLEATHSPASPLSHPLPGTL